MGSMQSCLCYTVYGAQVIVMACNEQEAGKHKCENYWTQEEERDKQFGKFFVSLLKSRDICPDFLVRTMR
jgi:tyrosine-protein phosphatase non-receptor type 12/18/22